MAQVSPRQQDILDLARREGRVGVYSLAARFDVTPQTIRKDLNDLCHMEKLNRVHGGAVYPSNTVNLTHQSRWEIAPEAKRAIAKRTAAIIPDGASLILNIGTTTEMVAEELRRHQGLMVITNNLNIAMILHDTLGIDVIVSGGMVRKSDGGLVGAAAVDLIRQFKVDFAIIGASAIDGAGTLLDFDYREVRVAKTILEQSRTRVLVADSTKFERKAPVQIGHLADIDLFVTDKEPSQEIRDICAAHDVEIVVPEPENRTQDQAAE